MSMHKNLSAWALLTAAALSSPVLAEDASDDPLQPDVVIKQDKRGLIEEYRINGRVYMIKVTPKKGPPYYLVDSDGDGELESRKNELAPNLLIPSWVLFRW